MESYGVVSSIESLGSVHVHLPDSEPTQYATLPNCAGGKQSNS